MKTMKWPQFNNRYLIPFEVAALITTAAFTPWWGTIAVIAAMRILFFTKVRILSFAAYASWAAVCIYRDTENLHGPSRTFAKLFSLSKFGFALDSNTSRAIVYALIGFVGFALAFFTATAIKALQQLATRTPTTPAAPSRR